MEYERKKRYENHINILIAHSEANTTPNSLSRNNFPSALITTDIIPNRTLNELIETTQQQYIQITMKRLQELIIEIETNLLKIKKDLQIYKLFDDEYFDNLIKNIDTELTSTFKKSWNKVDKIIKKQNPFNNSDLNTSSESPKKPTPTLTTSTTTTSSQKNNYNNQNKTTYYQNNNNIQKNNRNGYYASNYNFNNPNNHYNNNYNQNQDQYTSNQYNKKEYYNNKDNNFLYQRPYSKQRLKSQK